MRNEGPAFAEALVASRDGGIRTRDPLNPIPLRGNLRNGNLSVFQGLPSIGAGSRSMKIGVWRQKRHPKRRPSGDHVVRRRLSLRADMILAG